MEVGSPVDGDEVERVAALQTVAEGGAVDDTRAGSEHDGRGLGSAPHVVHIGRGALTKKRNMRMGRLSHAWKTPMRVEKMVLKSRRPIAFLYLPEGQSLI